MRRERLKATLIALAATLLLAASIVFGSRKLQNFDAALVGYTFATLFAAFGIVRRYALWIQRPPTAMYWKRGWHILAGLLHPRHIHKNLFALVRRFVVNFTMNRFIWRRSKLRGLAHWCIMWGSLTAAAVTFPLVFGWIHFVTENGDYEHYRVMVFGIPTNSFPVDSLVGYMTFHALVWSSFLVIAGVLIAMHRRLHDYGAAALQQFGEDWMPLLLLFAISVTGLMLTASSEWMKGYAYDFLAILHAITVIFTLLWLPFGKLFHIFQRSAQIGVAIYRDVGQQGEQAACRRCGTEFASRMHVEDLISVERKLGYRYDMPGTDAEHYQWICPKCRRALFGLAQGAMWAEARSAEPELSAEPDARGEGEAMIRKNGSDKTIGLRSAIATPSLRASGSAEVI